MSGINHVTLYQLSGPNAHSTTCPLLTVAGWMVAVSVTTLVLGLLPHFNVSQFVGIDPKPFFIITGLFSAGAVGAVALAYIRNKKSYPLLNKDPKKLSDNQAFFYRYNKRIFVGTKTHQKPLEEHTTASLRHLKFLSK